MKTENNRLYLCDEGKVFRRISDGFIMGDGIDLGDDDTIENYEEIDDPNPQPKEEEEDHTPKRHPIRTVHKGSESGEE